MPDMRRVFNRRILVAMMGAMAVPLQSLPVFASEDPIPGVDVIVEKVPPDIAVGRTKSDGNGYIRFRSLSSGSYVVSDEFGNKATARHGGGPVRWRIVGSSGNGKPSWTLVDESRSR